MKRASGFWFSEQSPGQTSSDNNCSQLVGVRWTAGGASDWTEWFNPNDLWPPLSVSQEVFLDDVRQAEGSHTVSRDPHSGPSWWCTILVRFGTLGYYLLVLLEIIHRIRRLHAEQMTWLGSNRTTLFLYSCFCTSSLIASHQCQVWRQSFHTTEHQPNFPKLGSQSVQVTIRGPLVASK